MNTRNPTARRALMFIKMADYMTRNGLDPSLRVSDLGEIYNWLIANGMSYNTALNYTSSLMSWLQLSKDERKQTELAFLSQLMPNVGQPSLEDMSEPMVKELKVEFVAWECMNCHKIDLVDPAHKKARMKCYHCGSKGTMMGITRDKAMARGIVTKTKPPLVQVAEKMHSISELVEIPQSSVKREFQQ